MTLPTIVPTGFAATNADFLRVKKDSSGAVRNVRGSVSVPSGTAATTVVGLVPFSRGASFAINDKSVHCGNFGAASTTVDLGIIYDDNVTFTNDFDAFASLATAPQAGGFVTIDEVEGMTLSTAGNGWLCARINTADADATAPITFTVNVSYDV